MARPLRITFPDASYNVTTCGNERKAHIVKLRFNVLVYCPDRISTIAGIHAGPHVEDVS
jgi:hypothetical protein